MYESPITVMMGEMRIQRDGEIYRAVQECGINVDKTELLNALKYDRDQYDKGYKDGIRKFAEMLREFKMYVGTRSGVFITDEDIDNLVKETGGITK